MTDAIDYRSLLVRYIRHVRYSEGDDFIPPFYSGGDITSEEWAELERLQGEATQDDLDNPRRGG